MELPQYVKITWKVVHELEEDGIIVRVSASETARPRYTFQIGRRGRDGTAIIPFLQAFVEGRGRVRVRPVADTVARLLNRAEEYVSGEAQKAEDVRLEEQIKRDERGVAREGKKRKAVYKQAGGGR